MWVDRLTFAGKPIIFNLRAQPNCHIATLTQAFIVQSPVGDLSVTSFQTCGGEKR
jgi:hypothetical protein